MDDELIAAVSRVLFEIWDPMGVRAEDPNWPADEYEGYAAGVLAVVLRHASDDVIAEHLAAIEVEWMGLVPSPLAHRTRAAGAIREAVRATLSRRRYLGG
jgi:hypothetical protein